jgi:microcin C transport system substrate-binding protein
VQSLKKLGIKTNVRMVDVSQYINRLRTFDFDMMITTIGQSQSPGNEQIAYWHSSTANIDSSRNYMGVSNPVVDQLVKMVVEAPDRDELVFRTRALDRVLLHQYYLIPQWHISTHRIAYWDKFGQPAVTPKYDSMHNVGLLSWWIDPQKEKHLQKVRSKK